MSAVDQMCQVPYSVLVGLHKNAHPAKVTEQMVVDACDAQEPGWDRFDRSLWWPVLNGLRAALGDSSSPTIYPPDPPLPGGTP